MLVVKVLIFNWLTCNEGTHESFTTNIHNQSKALSPQCQQSMIHTMEMARRAFSQYWSRELILSTPIHTNPPATYLRRGCQLDTVVQW